MKFFRDVQGIIHPIEKIERIYPSHQRPGIHGDVCAVAMVDFEGDVYIYASTASKIEMASLQMIPAQSGTAFIYPGDNEDDAPHMSAIIAWAYCADGELRGVSAHGVNDGGVSNADYILLPNGKVHEYDGQHDNITAWLKQYFENRRPAPTDAPAQ